MINVVIVVVVVVVMANRFPKFPHYGDKGSSSDSDLDDLEDLNDAVMSKMMSAIKAFGGGGGAGDGNVNHGSSGGDNERGPGFGLTIFHLSYTSQLQKKNPYDPTDMSNRVEVEGFSRGDGTSIPMMVPKLVKDRGHGSPEKDSVDIKTIVDIADLVYKRVMQSDGFRVGYKTAYGINRKWARWYDNEEGLPEAADVMTFNLKKVQDWLRGYDIGENLALIGYNSFDRAMDEHVEDGNAEEDGDADDEASKEDDEDGSSSGTDNSKISDEKDMKTDILPMLIIRRCQILCNRADPTTDYHLILGDLRIAQRLCPTTIPKVEFLMYYLMAVCQRKVGYVTEASKALAKAESLLKEPFEPESLYEKYQKKVADGKKALELPTVAHLKKVPIDPVLEECNQKIPSLSAKLEVKRSKSKTHL